jgi:hypothetical protein
MPDVRRTARGPQVHNDQNEPALGHLTFSDKRIKKVLALLAAAIADCEKLVSHFCAARSSGDVCCLLFSPSRTTALPGLGTHEAVRP